MYQCSFKFVRYLRTYKSRQKARCPGKIVKGRARSQGTTVYMFSSRCKNGWLADLSKIYMPVKSVVVEEWKIAGGSLSRAMHTMRACPDLRHFLPRHFQNFLVQSKKLGKWFLWEFDCCHFNKPRHTFWRLFWGLNQSKNSEVYFEV